MNPRKAEHSFASGVVFFVELAHDSPTRRLDGMKTVIESTMTEDELLLCIAPGEDSKHQFKVDIHNAESIATEMVAFANVEGMLYILV